MTTTPATVIPRLADESAKAHAAKVTYVTAGTQRSLEKLRQQIGTRSVRYLELWSAAHDWGATARAWDDQQAAAVEQHARTTYIADLDDHRVRYGLTGKALHAKAVKALALLDPATMTMPQIVAAVATAADLEAHALRIGELLPRLLLEEP